METVKIIYAARRSVLIREGQRHIALQQGDISLAAQLRKEINQIKAEILKQYQIILD